MSRYYWLAVLPIALLVFLFVSGKDATQRYRISEDSVSFVSKTPSVDYPSSGDSVKSPLSITGSAPGFWFFEATMPVRLESASGEAISSGYVTAEGEWMTEKDVRFTGTLPFSAIGAAFLVFQKANPSDLPENAAEYKIPLLLIK